MFPHPLTPNKKPFSLCDIEKAIIHDDGLAARQHLAAGRPIYYGDDGYPEGLVKKYPDGRKQLVSVSKDGKISVIRNL